MDGTSEDRQVNEYLLYNNATHRILGGEKGVENGEGCEKRVENGGVRGGLWQLMTVDRAWNGTDLYLRVKRDD